MKYQYCPKCGRKGIYIDTKINEYRCKYCKIKWKPKYKVGDKVKIKYNDKVIMFTRGKVLKIVGIHKDPRWKMYICQGTDDFKCSQCGCLRTMTEDTVNIHEDDIEKRMPKDSPFTLWGERVGIGEPFEVEKGDAIF